MKLFHGSNLEVDQVGLLKYISSKNFECGFYTTPMQQQAWRRAQYRAKIAGGIATVTVFEVPEDLIEKKNLNCCVLSGHPTIEWTMSGKNNYERNFLEYENLECNQNCKFDVVVSPVAIDTIGLLIWQFSKGILDAEYSKKKFDFDRLTSQYTFYTEKALKYLKKTGVILDQISD